MSHKIYEPQTERKTSATILVLQLIRLFKRCCSALQIEPPGFRRHLTFALLLTSLSSAVMLGSPSAHARATQGSLDICDFDDPTDLANLGDPGGALAVVADTGNDRVMVLGAGCSSFQLMDGAAPPELSSPAGVAVDPEGRIYVSDNGNNRILVFESVAGMNTDDAVDLLNVFGAGALSLNAPEGLGASDDGLIYIADTGAQRIQIMDSVGLPQGTLGTPDNGNEDKDVGELVSPSDVAVCASTAPGALAGRIFVTDRSNDTVQVFAPDGTALFRFGDTGSEPGMLSAPRSVAVDPFCNVYVADTSNGRVQMFDGDGGYLETLGLAGQPMGIALAPFGTSGGVYVSSAVGDDVRSFEYISYDVDGNGNSDDDGDSLPDIWEQDGIDLDFDGTIEYDLPAMGADPRRKNIFVEVDYLTFHLPRQDALDAVIDVFANSPVDNPDGSQGIDLTVIVDEEIEETPDRADLATWSEFDTLKGNFFGTVAERAASNAEQVLLAKLLAFRYALYGHIRDSDGSSGRAKGGGNFIVTLGASGWGNDPVTGHDVGTFKQQAGTFMHELGHTLSLGHGGIDGENYKSNYQSVMNYVYQTSWVQNAAIPDGRLDYSSQRLPTFDTGSLDESALDETQGLGLGDVDYPEDRARWATASGLILFGDVGDPLDWDGIGGPVNTATSGDLNDDGDQSVLRGQNDWQFLAQNPKAFNFRDSIGFAAFGQPLEDEQEELTDVEAQEIADFWRDAGRYRYVYSAKFLCVPLVGPEGTALSPGRYQTAINVHNPSTEEVRFMKKAVIARNELDNKRGVITPLEPDTLADDEAISIDCTSIAQRFDAPQPVGDGFVVIKSNEPLDVVAVYTSRDGVDVERIVPTEFNDEEEPEDDPNNDPGDNEQPPRPDLVIDLPSRTRVKCPSMNICFHSIEVEISNIGDADAFGPFDILVKSDNGLIGSETLAGLAAGDTATRIVDFPAGGNCYNTNCAMSAEVDSDNAVSESDETNNTAMRNDQG